MQDPELVDTAVLLPGNCYTCRTITGPFIDTRVEIPGDGRVYICVHTCLPTWARLAGFYPPEDANKAVALITQLQGENDGLRDRLRQELNVNKALNAAVGAGASA